jgi:hypothetical protein
MIRDHIDTFGVGPDGRLFRTYRGGIYLASTLWHVLQKGRKLAFTDAQLGSPPREQAIRFPPPGHLLAGSTQAPRHRW